MLVVDACVPDATRDAGSQRLLAIMRLLADSGWRVDFISDMTPPSNNDAHHLAKCGVRLRAGPVPSWLRAHGSDIDAVMLCRAPIATQYEALVRHRAPRAQLIFDTVDLHFLREERAARTLDRAPLRRQAARSRRRELALVAGCDLCLVVSEVERTLLAQALPGSRIEVLSTVVEVRGRRTGFEERAGLLFVGGFGHPPNLDGMRWFLDEIWKELLARDPTLMLHIAGDLTREARAQLTRDNVVLHGRVHDLSELLDTCRLSIAPLRFGAGVKGKVNMAMSHGLPVVATPIAAEGMHLRDGEDVLVAETAADFGAAVLRAYRDPTLWHRLSDGGLANVERHFSPAVAQRTIQRLFPARREEALPWA
jgi:glycosyltransferase involved in cell wall biosynthesis